MNCFIQYHSPHSKLITKDCSSVSHFHHCGQIWLPAVHFHSIHLLFLHYSTTIRYGTSFPKIPNFNLVKKLPDWTISAVPSISKLTECLHSSSGLLGAHGSVRHPRAWQARAQAPSECSPTHIHERTLWWEAGGQLWATVTGNGCREVSVPPGRPQCTRHSASMSTDSDRNPMIPRYEKQRHNGSLKAVVKDILAVFSQQTL